MSQQVVSPWWYVGYLFLGITVGLVFYVLHKSPNRNTCEKCGHAPQDIDYNSRLARKHLIMSIWLPFVLWIPLYFVIIAGTLMAASSSVFR